MNQRLFIAIELPPALCEQLGQKIAEFQAQLPKGCVRWVRPTGLHLTVKFLGDTRQETVPGLQDALTRAAQSVGPLALSLMGLGVFPHMRKPQVVWVGVQGQLTDLSHLYQAVENALTPLGFAPETREFAPHLTLGRVNGGQPLAALQALQALLQGAQATALGEFRAERLSLMKSQLRPGGSVYTQLFNVQLGQPTAEP